MESAHVFIDGELGIIKRYLTLSWASTSAPWPIRIVSRSLCPLAAARWREVRPSLSIWCSRAVALLINVLATSTCPSRDAIWSAVRPYRSSIDKVYGLCNSKTYHAPKAVFNTLPNTSQLVKNTPLLVIFATILTLFARFGNVVTGRTLVFVLENRP